MSIHVISATITATSLLEQQYQQQQYTPSAAAASVISLNALSVSSLYPHPDTIPQTQSGAAAQATGRT